MDPLSYTQQVESNARTYGGTFQQMFIEGNGIRVWDARGREYIDCLSNAGALPLGHNNPEVKKRVLAHVSSDQLQLL